LLIFRNLTKDDFPVSDPPTNAALTSNAKDDILI